MLKNIWSGFFSEVKRAVDQIKNERDEKIKLLEKELDQQNDLLVLEIKNLRQSFEDVSFP